MSINLIANEKDLKSAFDIVSNSTTGNEWFVFYFTFLN